MPDPFLPVHAVHGTPADMNGAAERTAPPQPDDACPVTITHCPATGETIVSVLRRSEGGAAVVDSTTCRGEHEIAVHVRRLLRTARVLDRAALALYDLLEHSHGWDDERVQTHAASATDADPKQVPVAFLTGPGPAITTP